MIFNINVNEGLLLKFHISQAYPKGSREFVSTAIFLRVATFLKLSEIHTFQYKTPKERKRKISDHLSLWTEFQINKLTRELDQIINPENHLPRP